MTETRHWNEISILQEADAGMKVQELCRKHSVSPASYYIWKSKYGGVSSSQHLRATHM